MVGNCVQRMERRLKEQQMRRAASKLRDSVKRRHILFCVSGYGLERSTPDDTFFCFPAPSFAFVVAFLACDLRGARICRRFGSFGDPPSALSSRERAHFFTTQCGMRFAHFVCNPKLHMAGSWGQGATPQPPCIPSPTSDPDQGFEPGWTPPTVWLSVFPRYILEFHSLAVGPL